MTKPKPSYSGMDMRIPICTKQLACDGISLTGKHARERGYCGKCADLLKKKAKPKVIPPRGENSALSAKLRASLPANWNGDD